jgi:lipoate-protein ligase A
MTLDEFQKYLGEYICGNFTPYTYTEADLEAIEKLKNEKYGLDSWNFGHSPAYTTHNIKKFPGGLVEVNFTVMKGEIAQLEIFGDYFFTKPTEEFVSQMIGTPHTREALLGKLTQINTPDYFSSITAEQMVEMFF